MFEINSEITVRQKQLLDLLRKCNDELSSQELHRQVLTSNNPMGLTTVYRNLQVLVKEGLVRSRHLPTGEILYTPVERDTHHLTCVRCGETTPLEECPVEKISLQKPNFKKFELLFHTLEFFGLCEACYKSK